MEIKYPEERTNKKVPWLSIFIISISVLFAGCASVEKSGPSAASAFHSAQNQEYTIQAGDQLDIKFFYNPDLNEQVFVRPDGRISLQLVHEIVAAGLTPSQLADLLKKKYEGELDNPEVTVILRSFGGQRVYIDGEVSKPGIINLITPLTVAQSLAEAGGVKETAKLSEIILIRRGPDNKPVGLIMNMEKVIYGTDPGSDIYLMPNDIVYVPRSSIANFNIWVDQYIRKNIPLSLGFFYNINPRP